MNFTAIVPDVCQSGKSTNTAQGLVATGAQRLRQRNLAGRAVDVDGDAGKRRLGRRLDDGAVFGRVEGRAVTGADEQLLA